ncbi:MAG: hypothetical protein COA94_06930 [Rickettsiales bacterium]|nr:MAG: hypothetical protein COA94_06930 [Rickettsiales bacterium]
MSSKLTIFTLKDIRDMPESRVVIILNDQVYDVTDYLVCHPGGREVLLENNRKDATEAFSAIGHSDRAEEILKEYKIGSLAEKERSGGPPLQSNALSSSPEPLKRVMHIKNKLVTEEDPYFFHKIFGLIVLLHMAIRFIVLGLDAGEVIIQRDIIGFNSDNVFSDGTKLFFAFCHGILSVSSFIFAVPKHSSQNKPMIHQMFRGHSVCFASRAVLCMVVDVLVQSPELKRFLISCIVLSCLIAADQITKYLATEDDRYKTTNSMPYWRGCSVEREHLHKTFYAFAQFLASIICLFGSYTTIFFTLPAIQGAALLMTLTRKNIITSHSYHQIYTFLLFYPIPLFLVLWPAKTIFAIILSGVLYYLRSRNINKYLLWIPVLIMANMIELTPENYPNGLIIGAAIFLLTLYIVKSNAKIIETERIDGNNRVVSHKQITPDAYELIIRTQTPIKLEIGQHVLIQINDSLNRKYTPIWTKYLPETDQTLLCLRIKEYKSTERLTASSYLARCGEGSVLALHGPYGNKFYCPKNDAIIDKINKCQYNLEDYQVYLFSAGSGITPIYQLAKNICKPGQKRGDSKNGGEKGDGKEKGREKGKKNEKLTLITCDQKHENQMMKDELTQLKEDFPNELDWLCFLSREGKNSPDIPATIFKERLTPGKLMNIVKCDSPSLIIICGPDKWQEMIQQTINLIDFDLDKPPPKCKVLAW